MKLKNLPEQILQELFYRPLFMLYEETDLALRTWSVGLKVIALPVIVGEHIGGASLKRVPDLTAYLALRNSLVVQRRAFRPSLKKYRLLKLIRHLSDIPASMFHGYRGKLLTRAFIDGVFRKFGTSGPSLYYPLIIVPKELKFKTVQIMLLAVRWRMLRKLSSRYEYRLRTLTIKDNDLKELATPFLVQLSIDT